MVRRTFVNVVPYRLQEGEIKPHFLGWLALAGNVVQIADEGYLETLTRAPERVDALKSEVLSCELMSINIILVGQYYNPNWGCEHE